MVKPLSLPRQLKSPDCEVKLEVFSNLWLGGWDEHFIFRGQSKSPLPVIKITSVHLALKTGVHSWAHSPTLNTNRQGYQPQAFTAAKVLFSALCCTSKHELHELLPSSLPQCFVRRLRRLLPITVQLPGSNYVRRGLRSGRLKWLVSLVFCTSLNKREGEILCVYSVRIKQ